MNDAYKLVDAAEGKNVMGNSRDNKFTAHQRLAGAEAEIQSLKAELASVRTTLRSELLNAVSDTVGRTGAPGRDGASVIGPVRTCWQELQMCRDLAVPKVAQR